MPNLHHHRAALTLHNIAAVLNRPVCLQMDCFLVNELGLNADTMRLAVQQMGCMGGFRYTPDPCKSVIMAHVDLSVHLSCQDLTGLSRILPAASD